MPFPIAHSAAGVATYFALKKDHFANLPTQEKYFLFWCILLANLPDFDFIPGLLLSEPGKFHHGISHSILFCLIITLLFYPFVNLCLITNKYCYKRRHLNFFSAEYPKTN